jgi:hypothetical protein
LCTAESRRDFDANVKKLLDKFDIDGNLVVNTTGATNDVAKAVDYKGFAILRVRPMRRLTWDLTTSRKEISPCAAMRVY